MSRLFRRSVITLVPVVALVAAVGGARAEIIDQIAAVVEGQVLTTSAIERLASTNFIPRQPGEPEADYRRRLLAVSIDFILQRRDAERFGLKDVQPEEVDARIDRLAKADGTREQLIARIAEVGMSEDDLRNVVRQRIQVEAYIEERFAPLIFISLEEIERYYLEAWSQRKRDEGEPVPPLADVRERLRESLRAERLEVEVRRWTEQLRNRANVDIYAYQ